MPFATADDGTMLYYADEGAGEAILFLHEYGGDPRSWDPQIDAFAKTNRCITTASRGYAPSGIPDDPDAYSHEIVAEDARAVLDHLGADKAHVVGLSMGAYTGLMLALRHPERVITLTAASGGSGSHPEVNPAYRAESQRLADAIAAADQFPADDFAGGPTRLQLKRKNLAEWERFRDELADHDVTGAAHVMRQIVGARLSLYAFKDQLAALSTPVLFMVGDEDGPGTGHQPVAQTHHAGGRVGGRAEIRAFVEFGRAGRLQPAHQKISPIGGGRKLALAGHVDGGVQRRRPGPRETINAATAFSCLRPA